jgi:hypothetical protein
VLKCPCFVTRPRGRFINGHRASDQRPARGNRPPTRLRRW